MVWLDLFPWLDKFVTVSKCWPAVGWGGAAGECASVFPPRNPVEENTAFIRETETAALLSLLVLSDINSPCHVNEELLLHTTQTSHLCPAEGALKLFIFPPASVTFTLHRKQLSLDVHLILSLFVGRYVMWFFFVCVFPSGRDRTEDSTEWVWPAGRDHQTSAGGYRQHSCTLTHPLCIWVIPAPLQQMQHLGKIMLYPS